MAICTNLKAITLQKRRGLTISFTLVTPEVLQSVQESESLRKQQHYINFDQDTAFNWGCGDPGAGHCPHRCIAPCATCQHQAEAMSHVAGYLLVGVDTFDVKALKQTSAHSLHIRLPPADSGFTLQLLR